MDRPSSRRSSFNSQHSGHSPPRLSIDKRHSTDRRSSTDSTIRTPLPNFPGLATLPGISSNSPLAPTGPRGMPPPTPPKDRLPPPQTPTRKPVQRQKSPLSTEAFSSASPAPSMPGAFPSTPSPGPPVGMPSSQSNTTAYAEKSSPSSTPSEKKTRGKRTSSLRDFLPFKALRKSYDNQSPDGSPQNGRDRPSSAFGMRPTTPGAESLTSKSTNPSLRKKMSGTFWKRKSSLLNFGGGADENAVANEDGSVAPSTNETLVDDQPMRSTTPMPGDEIQGVKKRKSGTFWKRKSNLSLFNAYNNAEQTGTKGIGPATNGSATTNGKSGSNSNGNTNGHTYETSNGQGHHDNDVVMGGTSDRAEYSNGTYSLPVQRSPSPPPQLPAFIGGGGGLGLGVDEMFKNFD